MIDTIKNAVQAGLFEYLIRNGSGSSSEIHAFIKENEEKASLVTVKRLLSRLKRGGVLSSTGGGRSVRYSLTPFGRITVRIDAHKYCAMEPDVRFGLLAYQFDIFPNLVTDPFTKKELASLESATRTYHEKSAGLSQTLHQKELERFVIELSWKSSRIEGNTYTFLDTERLLLRGIEAQGHSKNEAAMILNHKTAFTYIYENRDAFRKLTRAGIEQVHELLTGDLSVARNVRTSPVGVTGSRYLPLDNAHQINEALETLLMAVERMPHGYAKALVAILGLSYIQPFEDGNKRTARLTANALLLAHGLSPLSYRSVSEEEYREATLAFYELNSLEPFKNLFIEQYLFAAETYRLT